MSPPRPLALALSCLFTLLPCASAQMRPPPEGISMSFSGKPLTEVMSMVADVTGKRFLFQGGSGGRGVSNQLVFFECEDLIPVNQVYPVFEAIMRVHDFALIPAGDEGGRMVKVVSIQHAQIQVTEHIGLAELEAVKNEDRFVCFTYCFRNVSDGLRIQQQLRTIAPGTADGLMILGFQNLPVVSVTGFAPTVYRIYQMMKAIDEAIAPPQVAAIPLEYAVAEEVQAILTRVQGGSAAAGRAGLTVEAHARTNSLILGGSEADLAIARATIRTLDVPARAAPTRDEGGAAALLAALESEHGEALLQALRDLAAARRAVVAALADAREAGADLDDDVQRLLDLLDERKDRD